MINLLIIQPTETNWYLSNKRISLELVYLLYKIFNEAKYNSNGHDCESFNFQATVGAKLQLSFELCFYTKFT